MHSVIKTHSLECTAPLCGVLNEARTDRSLNTVEELGQHANSGGNRAAVKQNLPFSSLAVAETNDAKRGQNLEAEARVLRPRPRWRPEL